jgi:uncharacterized protein (TIGR02118 family)
MSAQLLVLYPTPTDVKGFEKRYREEHLPFAEPRLKGATRVVTKKVMAPPGATAEFHLMSEVHFSSLSALQACATQEGAREALEHAASISSGGAPRILIVEDVETGSP